MMDSERFSLFINKLKNGETPTTTGRCFSSEQIETVKSIYKEQNRELDDYFKACIEARLRK